MEAGFVSRQSLPYSLFHVRYSLFSLPLAPCSLHSRYKCLAFGGISASLRLANKVVPLRGHQYDMIMKFIILLLAIYLFYRYFLRQPKALPPQEPDVFVHHEEVKKEHEKNK